MSRMESAPLPAALEELFTSFSTALPLLKPSDLAVAVYDKISLLELSKAEIERIVTLRLETTATRNGFDKAMTEDFYMLLIREFANDIARLLYFNHKLIREG